MHEDNLIFYEKRKLSGTVSVLGVPLDLGKDAVGTALGPKYLRKFGLKQMCEDIGLSYKDLGDIKCADRRDVEMGDTKIKYLSEIARVAGETARVVESEISLGNRMLVLGGDHALSVGSISGVSVACQGDLGVIWIDAHGDMMTDKNTISGNIHGMPSSAIMGLGHPDLVNVLKPGSKIKQENIVYIGLKDLDQGEIDLIRSGNLNAVTMMDIVSKGFEPIMAKIIELQSRVKNIWVSLDIDSVDIEYAPATLMANVGGLTQREIIHITKFIGKVCRVAGMDLVELAPKLDKNGKTMQLAIELISHILGSEYGWYTQYMKKEAEKQARAKTKLTEV